MIVPSLDILANLRFNQWIAHLPEDHPLVQQYRVLLQETTAIKWTSLGVVIGGGSGSEGFNKNRDFPTPSS